MIKSTISVQNLYKSFPGVHALEGVSFEVEKGQVLGLLGPNGAGKTTIVRILTTLLRPDSGSAFIAGIDVVKDPALVRNHIGLAGQYAAVDENLTGKENLELVGRLYHLPISTTRKKAQELLRRFSLTDKAHRQVKTYSGGMRRRLDLAASLVGEAQILFLDEPTAGLDPRSRAELWKIIEELVKEGTTLLLTTQYLEEADYLADRIIMLDQGRIVAEGTSHELKARIGGGVLQVRFIDKHQAIKAGQLLKNIGAGIPHIDEVSETVTVPIKDGSKTLIHAVRIIDEHGLEISDIELRKPTLDEVFLELTQKP